MPDASRQWSGVLVTALRHAADLEALRAAGAGIYAELGRAEQERTRLVAEARDLWSPPTPVAGDLVATWNAFVLQTLAAGLLDADYAADAGTVGYVPQVTFDQAWSWFAAATGWLSQAQQAHAQIQAAVESGAVTRASGMRLGSYFYCCPWSPIYQVRKPAKINGKRLSPPQQFTFDVSGEGLAEGHPFVRRILLGPFQATSEVDYCDPESGHHDDD